MDCLVVKLPVTLFAVVVSTITAGASNFALCISYSVTFKACLGQRALEIGRPGKIY